MNQSDSIQYDKLGFDGKKYIALQREKILERMAKFDGRLYLEIGGKFLFDAHASRVLPGFVPESKKKIFAGLLSESDIIFCVSAGDIVHNRQLSNEEIKYTDYVQEMLAQIVEHMEVKPFVVINKCPRESLDPLVQEFAAMLQAKGYQVFHRYLIDGYPHSDSVVSDAGYGSDDYIPVTKNLVLVTGAASNSGKMSTCLGQIYLDHGKSIESGYAKYETFPIWNKPLSHPVNLAYEAATADIEDYNCMDSYHQKAYGIDSVNYNRDVDGFEIVMDLASKIVGEDNFTKSYKSPTDMGISSAGFCITDEAVVKAACLAEIRRRKRRYQEMVDRGEGEMSWVEKCEELEAQVQA